MVGHQDNTSSPIIWLAFSDPSLYCPMQLAANTHMSSPSTKSLNGLPPFSSRFGLGQESVRPSLFKNSTFSPVSIMRPKFKWTSCYVGRITHSLRFSIFRYLSIRNSYMKPKLRTEICTTAPWTVHLAWRRWHDWPEGVYRSRGDGLDSS